jgi:hypothetical protein
MKKLFILLIIPVMTICCKKANNSECPEPKLSCDGIMCITHNFNFDFRIVDKTSGADLVFGPSPRYATSDIKLYYEAAMTNPIPLFADGTAKSFRSSMAKGEMYLSIAGGTPLKLNAEFKGVSCCASQVKSLKVAGESVCTCCNDVIHIGVQ